MIPKRVETVCLPLDPDDCGSVVHGYVRFPELYRVNYGKKLWDIEYSANISLSDCNRIIQWGLSGGEKDAFNVAKIDRAISALTKMREHMVEAQEEMKKTRQELRERNLALDPEWKED